MNTSPANKALSNDQAIIQARDFLAQYYSDSLNHEKPQKPHAEREKEVLKQLRYVIDCIKNFTETRPTGLPDVTNYFVLKCLIVSYSSIVFYSVL